MRKLVLIYLLIFILCCYVLIYLKLPDEKPEVMSSRILSQLNDCPGPSQYPVELLWWQAKDNSKRQELNFTAILTKTLKTTETATRNLLPGGHWRPPHCKPRHNIAILVPYRNRPEQLQIFINYIHPFLQRQNLEYTIYVIEQTDTSRFNRAKLFNIGFVESRKLKTRHGCYYFHDVDMLPENDLNLYDCPKQPRQHCVAMDKFNYRSQYKSYFGGVTAMQTEHFELINGFSNLFYGWGGEDDNFFASAADRGRLEAFLRRSSLFQYRPDSAPSFLALCDAADDKLFKDILSNTHHILFPLLPPDEAKVENNAISEVNRKLFDDKTSK